MCDSVEKDVYVQLSMCSSTNKDKMTTTMLNSTGASYECINSRVDRLQVAYIVTVRSSWILDSVSYPMVV